MVRKIQVDDFVEIRREGEDDGILYAILSISYPSNQDGPLEITIYPLNDQTDENVIVLQRNRWKLQGDERTVYHFDWIAYEDKPNEEDEEFLYDLITDAAKGSQDALDRLSVLLEDPSPEGVTRKQIVEKLALPFELDHPYPDFTHQYVEWLLDRGFKVGGRAPHYDGYSPYDFMQGISGHQDHDYDQAFRLLDRIHAVSKPVLSPFEAVLSYKEVLTEGSGWRRQDGSVVEQPGVAERFAEYYASRGFKPHDNYDMVKLEADPDFANAVAIIKSPRVKSAAKR